MSQQTRNPTSDEAVSGTWTGTPGSRWTVVDDHPDSTGVDELTHGTTTAGNLTFGFSAFTIPAGAVISSVVVVYYDYKNGSQSCNIGARLKVGGSYYLSGTHNPSNGSGNRTLRSDTFATNPATSTAWTVAEVNGTDPTNPLQAFGWNSSDANPSITLASIQIQVNYTVNYTLTADQASFTLTGQTTNLLYGRSFPVSSANYTLTGQDTILTYTPVVVDYPMLADQASYTLTGQTTNLLFGALVPAVQGSYTITGQDVLLTYVPAGPQAFTLTADQASYILTLRAAGFSFAGVAAASSTQTSDSINELCRRGIVAQIDGTAGLTGGSGAARALISALRRTHASDERTLDNYVTGFGTYNTVGLDRKVDEIAAVPGCSLSITLNHDLSVQAYKDLVTGAEWGNSVTGSPSNRRPKGVDLDESITSGLYPQMVIDLQHQIDRCIERWTVVNDRDAADLHFELTREPFFGGSHGLSEGAWGTYTDDLDDDFYDFWEYALPLLDFHGHRLWSWSLSGYTGVKYYRGGTTSTSALIKNRALLNSILGSSRFQALLPYFTYNGIPQLSLTMYAPIQGFVSSSPGLAAECLKIMMDDAFSVIDSYAGSAGAEVLVSEWGITRQWCGLTTNGYKDYDFARGRLIGACENVFQRYRRIYSSCLYVMRENMDGTSDTVHGLMDDNTFNCSRAIQGIALVGWGETMTDYPCGSAWVGASGEGAPF